MPGDYRNRSIYYIAKSLKKQHTKKNVRFNEKILYYKLICPNVIYYALYPRVGNLIDTNDLPIHTLGSDLFCNCSNYRIGKQDCSQANCKRCFGKMADAQKVMLISNKVDKVSN